MPRDSNGTYTLPGGNPVVANTAISKQWANRTMADIARELTNSLSRSGKGGMLVPFPNADGTVLLPGITWASETDSGWFRNAANDIRSAINGVVTTQHRDDTASTEGEQHPFRIWDGSAFYAPLTKNDGATPSFTALTSEGNVTVSSGGLTVTTGGLTVSAGGGTISGDLTATGDIDPTGTYELQGYWSKDYLGGYVDYLGNIDLDLGISSVSKIGAGKYEVTFDRDLDDGANYPMVMATCNNELGVPCYATIESKNANTAIVWCRSTSGGSSTSSGFAVMAYCPVT